MVCCSWPRCRWCVVAGLGEAGTEQRSLGSRWKSLWLCNRLCSCFPRTAWYPRQIMPPMPHILAWEVTRRCGLKCQHCRGASTAGSYDNELSTSECLKTIDSITRVARPMIILTGGEPLMRTDILDIAGYATRSGCRVVMATCGHLLTSVIAEKLKSCGVMALSISLDAATAAEHDAFRGVTGAFDASIRGLACLKAAGLPFQINTTVSRLNARDLPRILDLAVELGASTIDFFFLVPTGRGAAIADLELDTDERDNALRWIATMERTSPLRVRTTCAPQYQKFRLPDDPSRPSPPFHGCLGGRGFAFLSHTGILQPCGFLDIPCGDLRSVDYDLPRLVRESSVFERMQASNPYDECPARKHARGNPAFSQCRH